MMSGDHVLFNLSIYFQIFKKYLPIERDSFLFPEKPQNKQQIVEDLWPGNMLMA